jgi:hypothetical protein
MANENLIVNDVFNYMKIKQLDAFMCNHKGFIAGGCFKNLFNGERMKDVDVFFETEADFKEADDYYSSNDEFRLYY